MSDERVQTPFRLTPGQIKDLDAAAEARGMTRQGLLVYLTKAEIEHHKEVVRFKKAPITSATTTAAPVESAGLGISKSLRNRREDVVESAPVTPAQAPVVVQVGNTNAPTNAPASTLGELDRLAAYIVKGDEFMRDARKRTVIEILEASATTDEELKVLVARVEEIVATKTKTAAAESGVTKVARMAFDKINALLRGETSG